MLAAVPGIAVVLLLLHVPPDVVLLKDVDNPWHTLVVPVIATGLALMVTTAVVLQPVAVSEYVIVVVVKEPPPLTPVTTPVVDTTLPSAGILLLHRPPAGVEFNVVVKPTHTANEGTAVIAVGLAFTVTTAVLIQPVVVSE